MYDGTKQNFKDTYGKYTKAEFIVRNKINNIKSNANLENFEVTEELGNKISVKFKHDKTTIMKVMEEITKYCTIEDIHMKEAELEDILKEIYKGAHKC